MGVKFKLTSTLKRQVESIRKDFRRRAPRVYRNLIVEHWRKGKTPVKGGKWDKPYSKSYRDAIKKDISGAFGQAGKAPSPVNLKVSGHLWRQLKVELDGNNIVITIDDELADIHTNQGVRSKKHGKAIREMLPDDNGQDFNRAITGAIQRLLESIVDKFSKS